MHHDTHALCVGLQYGLPLGSSARWTICCLTYPLKPFPAGWPSYIPFKTNLQSGMVLNQNRQWVILLGSHLSLRFGASFGISRVVVVTFVLCVLGYHFSSVPVLDAGVCNTLYLVFGS